MFFDVYAGASNDPYIDPATGVLRNLLGISDQALLEKVESSLSFMRTHQANTRHEAGRFDLALLQRIHKNLFQDVYAWAGQLRTVEISKGDTQFARVVAIESAAGELFEELASEQQLTGLTAKDFSSRAAYYLGEINVIHPFREGNGRAQREFLRQLAAKAGHTLDWSRHAGTMVDASIAAYAGDYAGLAYIIQNCIEPGI